MAILTGKWSFERSLIFMVLIQGAWMSFFAKLAKLKKNKFFYFFSSLGLMCFAQPDLSVLACLIASVCGYAFFWKSNNLLHNTKARFFSALIWFASFSFVHLSWFTADRYVGWYIYLFLGMLLIILGVFFALLSLAIPKPEKVTITRALFIASLWTIFEWSRLFVMSGFSWNPVGLMLTAHIYTLQLVSVFGIFGLTFLIMFTNMIAYRVLFSRLTSYKPLLIILICLPFLFGFLNILYHEKKLSKSELLSLLLIQTSLYPEEKMAYLGMEKKMVPLLEQWKRIFDLVKKYQNKSLDLIVFSEAAVPYGTFLPIYDRNEAKALLQKTFFQAPYEDKENYVGNAFFAQNLSQIFDSHLIIGFEDGQQCDKYEVYNSAFLFHPNAKKADRYEKRILVPLGEYIPFSFCKKFLSRYGISDSFTPGKEAKVFSIGKVPIGLSICYEETYGHLMRQNRKKGAQLLVNLTNDVWYPHSRLPIVHFHHGKVRAVETGIPLVRASNTGVTCAVDSIGRVIDMLPYEKKGVDCPSDALYVKVPSYCYSTLYTHWGDGAIISFSIICLFCFGIARVKRFRNKIF